MKTEETVELTRAMIEFLDAMVRKYQLPSRDKAIRCLISYARHQHPQQDEIFKTIRCLDC